MDLFRFVSIRSIRGSTIDRNSHHPFNLPLFFDRFFDAPRFFGSSRRSSESFHRFVRILTAIEYCHNIYRVVVYKIVKRERKLGGELSMKTKGDLMNSKHGAQCSQVIPQTIYEVVAKSRRLAIVKPGPFGKVLSSLIPELDVHLTCSWCRQ
jgi:hypothetical protein